MNNEQLGPRIIASEISEASRTRLFFDDKKKEITEEEILKILLEMIEEIPRKR